MAFVVAHGGTTCSCVVQGTRCLERLALERWVWKDGSGKMAQQLRICAKTLALQFVFVGVLGDPFVMELLRHSNDCGLY